MKPVKSLKPWHLETLIPSFKRGASVPLYIYACFYLFVSLFLLLVLLSYSPEDKTFPFAQLANFSPEVSNRGGIFGSYLAGLIFFLFGYGSFLFPSFLLLWGIESLRSSKACLALKGNLSFRRRFLFLLLLIISFVSLLSSLQLKTPYAYLPGGVVGPFISNLGLKYLGKTGNYLFLSFILLFSLSGVSNFSWFFLLSKLTRRVSPSGLRKRLSLKKPVLKRKNKIKVKKVSRTIEPHPLPPLSLLKIPEKEERKVGGAEEARIIEKTLLEFGIEARVSQYNVGSRITLYELELSPGITPHRISALSDNLAMALKCTSVRVIAPLPGKSTVGVEVPNKKWRKICLSEILTSTHFQKSSSKLTLAVGKDTLGEPLLINLASLPHLLIAGATGSGKTVCLNGLIASILFQSTPEEVKFILVDPKMVELSLYKGIPHLLLPVLTETDAVVKSLRWLIREMETRYRLFSEEGVRNLEGHNLKNKEKLPYIVVIIDELADLIVSARNELEKSIIRLSQLARASGIHLILATQRPSVDILTGVIKANLPARISFQVSSGVDSRTILDTVGAEKLMGKGDLLYLPPTGLQPIRAQGTFISDKEIEKLVEFLKSQGEPDYAVEILKESREEERIEGKDPLYQEALEIVQRTKIASISLLQRRLRIGFNRAARLIEMMEEEGIVGPYQEGKPRRLL